MKIVLTGPALRVFMEDHGEEFQLEIRDGIIKSAVRNARTLIGDSFDKEINSIKEALNSEINKEALKSLGELAHTWRGTRFTLDPTFQKKIRSDAKTAMDNLIADTIAEHIKPFLSGESLSELLQNKVDRKFNHELDKLVNEKVAEKITKALNDN